MINWTDPQEGRELRTEYDLPVPMSVYECRNCIAEINSILGLFQKDDSELLEEAEHSIVEGSILLESLRPRNVSKHSEIWENAVKMWLFQREVIQTCQTGTEEHKDELMEICKEYLYLLREKAAAYEQ